MRNIDRVRNCSEGQLGLWLLINLQILQRIKERLLEKMIEMKIKEDRNLTKEEELRVFVGAVVDYLRQEETQKDSEIFDSFDIVVGEIKK